MMKNIIKSAAGVLAALSLTITGCSKFLDINDNPTKVVDLDPSYLLPSSQANISMTLGNYFQVYGGYWAQYWTQNISSSQYQNVDRVTLDPASFDRPWQFVYAGAIQDLQVIVDKANTKRLEQYAGISELLKAFSFQLMTDAFGNVPVTDAIKAGSQDILAPKYDEQKVVYDSIFAMIDRGLALIDPASTAKPGKDDLIFGGNMANWEAFGNTLKLRAYMRLTKIDSTRAADGIKALAGAAFLTTDAKMNFVATGGNNNPLFTEILGLGRTIQNIQASSTAVDQMNAMNDPRVFVFYRTRTDTFGIAGIPQGSFRTQWKYKFSPPNVAVGAYGPSDSSALAPVKYISAAESYFLQAEAAAHGWIPGDAKTLYEQGITASFTAYNVAPGTYITDAVNAFPATTEAQVKAIITQKYFAMCGNQNFEAWTEWRRTGYPTFLVRSAASQLAAGEMPQRLVYPNSEITRNPNFPGAQPVTAKVWWDAN